MDTQTKNSKIFNPFSKFFSSGFNSLSNSENNGNTTNDNDNDEGHLIVDMFEKDNSYFITAPAAGVMVDDIEIELNDDYLLIKGRRQRDNNDDKKIYILQECYWGSFSRKIDFPTQVDSEKAAATFKDGMLTICVPKTKSAQTKTLKIKTL
mgnify:CR=1 FL=1